MADKEKLSCLLLVGTNILSLYDRNKHDVSGLVSYQYWHDSTGGFLRANTKKPGKE